MPKTHRARSTARSDIDAIRDAVDHRMDDLLPQAEDDDDLVPRAMRASALAAGKRLRPILLVLTARDLGYSAPQALDAGCAVEMVHAASLMLDDMPCMDNASLRRGQPAIHLRFGEDVAILSAVALLSHAFQVLSTLPGVAPAVRARLAAVLSATVGVQGLVKGQYQDLREGRTTRPERAISATNDLKTSVLFGTSVRMAAILADAGQSVQACLDGFARELGQAFQLLDDLLDIDPAQAAAAGKDAHQDAGKSTMITLLGSDATLERMSQHLSRADAHLHRALGTDPETGRFVQAAFAKAMARPRVAMPA